MNELSVNGFSVYERAKNVHYSKLDLFWFSLKSLYIAFISFLQFLPDYLKSLKGFIFGVKPKNVEGQVALSEFLGYKF